MATITRVTADQLDSLEMETPGVVALDLTEGDLKRTFDQGLQLK